MQNVKTGMKKWGTIGLIFSFFVILFGIIIILANDSTTYNTISLIMMGFAAFIASFVMREERAERPMPILRFASGICLAAAIFSQAISIKNQNFAMIMYIVGFAFLILLMIDIYKKYLKKTGN